MTSAEFRPKVLLVTRNFPPLTGGMERLMQKAAEGVSSYATLTIVGPTGCKAFAPPNSTVFEVPFGLFPFVTLGSLAAIRACLQTRFDLVIGGSGLAAPCLRLLKAVFKVRTAIFVHGLDIVVDNGVYQKVFVPTLRNADLVIANSQNTRTLAIGKGVQADKVAVINPGTALPDPVTGPDRAAFCLRHGIPDRKIILFTGRITRRKGLSQFIARSMPDIISAQPTAILLIVGDNPDQSLNRLGEANEVIKAVADTGMGESVRFLGKVNDEELLCAYAAADVQVLPLIDVPGDVEGFGMVAIEAAALGTPTVAFDLGGVPDAVSTDNGALVPAGEYSVFAEAVVRILATAKPGSASCINHAQGFSWEIFDEKLEAAIGSKQWDETSR